MPHFERGTFKFIETFPGVHDLPCPVTIIEVGSCTMRTGMLVGTIACGDGDERNGKGLIRTANNKGEKVELAAGVDCMWSTDSESRQCYYTLRLDNGGHDPKMPDGQTI